MHAVTDSRTRFFFFFPEGKIREYGKDKMLCYSATRTIQANTILHNNSSRNISQMPIEDVYIECWTRKESRGWMRRRNPFKNVLKYTFTSIIGRKLCGLFPRVSFLISWTYIFLLSTLRAIVHKRVFLDLCLGHGRSRSIMRTTTTQDRSTDFFSILLIENNIPSSNCTTLLSIHHQ